MQIFSHASKPHLNAFLTADSAGIPSSINGPVEIVVLATGKNKAATDELVAMLLKVKAVADKEPGCRLVSALVHCWWSLPDIATMRHLSALTDAPCLFCQYHISRSTSDNTVTILESYDSKAAVEVSGLDSLHPAVLLPLKYTMLTPTTNQSAILPVQKSRI